jgi:hypothetical protein
MIHNITSKKYDKIKKALFSLLCRGDDIYYIFSNKNKKQYGQEIVNTIRSYRVLEVNNKESIMIDDDGYVSLEYFNNIEHYNGKLYIWNTFGIYDLDNKERKKKVEQMIKIIESPNTINLINRNPTIYDLWGVEI